MTNPPPLSSVSDTHDAAPATDLNGVCALPQLGVIRAAGDDAAKFLHGQLTQDFALLDASHARLAALCSPKGRMLASFIGLRRGADIVLVCDRGILAQTLKRLSMFVLRAKVRLSDASADFSVYGLVGAAVAANTGGSAAPAAWDVVEAGPAGIVGLHPAQDGVSRALWIAPADAAVPVGDPIAPELWQWAEVASGVAMISAPVVEAFVPQMLNYESVGGVNFKKGCYPGQEVVARSQFRGTLKRRAFIVHCDAPLAAGDEVFHRDVDTGTVAPQPAAADPCGIVVQAARAPHGGFDAIVSLQIASTQQGELRARASDGPALELRPLPYPLLTDI